MRQWLCPISPSARSAEAREQKTQDGGPTWANTRKLGTVNCGPTMIPAPFVPQSCGTQAGGLYSLLKDHKQDRLRSLTRRTRVAYGTALQRLTSRARPLPNIMVHSPTPSHYTPKMPRIFADNNIVPQGAAGIPRSRDEYRHPGESSGQDRMRRKSDDQLGS